MGDEDTGSFIPLLSRGNEFDQGPIDDSPEPDPLLPTPVYESYGWRFGQDWIPSGAAADGNENTQTDGADDTQAEKSHVVFWEVPEGSTGRPRKVSSLSASDGQDFAQSCDQKRRKFVVSSRPELGEQILSGKGQQDLPCLPTVRGEISISLKLQVILYGLGIGTEIQHYRMVSACLDSLGEKLGAIVLVTGDSTEGYDNPSAEQKAAAFVINDNQSILTEIVVSTSRVELQARVMSSNFTSPTSPQVETAQAFEYARLVPARQLYHTEREQDRVAEISSPILRIDQLGWVIPEMFKALTSNFRLTFNGSTALHVQIGIGREYSLQDLKRISKAIVLFEEPMNTYHPKSRNPVSPIEWPYAYSNILPCRKSQPFRGLSDCSMMKKIDEARYIPELIRLINYDYLVYAGGLHRHYRYNFRDIIRTGTIEFRQAIGTVQEHQALDWISRVIKFVTSAVTTSDAEFNGWANCGISNVGIYHRFGVPPPPETSFRLRIQMRAQRRQTRAVGISINRVIGKTRKRSTYVFEQVRAGRIGRKLSWFVYYWGKIDSRMSSSHRVRVLFPTVILDFGVVRECQTAVID